MHTTEDCDSLFSYCVVKSFQHFLQFCLLVFFTELCPSDAKLSPGPHKNTQNPPLLPFPFSSLLVLTPFLKQNI